MTFKILPFRINRNKAVRNRAGFHIDLKYFIVCDFHIGLHIRVKNIILFILAVQIVIHI